MFDYLIVGGGAAGCVLAARLSEDPAVSVCLLEAGPPDRSALVHCPAGFALLARLGNINWGFETVPQPGLLGRRGYQPRGKVLGGSASVNAMIYIRGHRLDYADWVADGADGWSWDELLPHFVRTEDQQRIRNGLHGQGGPVAAYDPPAVHPVTRAMIQACTQAGMEAVDDFNDGHPRGAGVYQLNMRDGRRASIARGAIEPALGRPNLHLVTGALVQRITLEGLRATGVAWRAQDGSPQFTRARAEVLLCAGTLQSPQLLMASGLGPQAHLREHGIAVQADLPGVGANLQDHACVPMAWRLKAGVPSLNPAFRGLGLVRSLLSYALFKRGPMTSPPAEFGAYLQSDPTLDRPDLQVFGLPPAESARPHRRQTPFWA